MDAILDRFLRYVAFPTTSAEGAAVWPSSPGQRDLGSALAAELAAMGLDRVRHDENGYVYARLPATPG
ncbi:MAG: peptidase T, partial [Planctomycetes bacterium]|nr:peptidase T [Planctomycetota bacterium]